MTDLDILLAAHRVAQERRGLLPNSMARRETHLRAFAKWLEPRSLLDATRNDVETFIDSRVGQDGGPITMRTRSFWLGHLRTFYKWAEREGLIDGKAPTADIDGPRLRRSIPRPIADADLRRAMDHATPTMRAMLALAAFQGLRCQEIAGLRREDVVEDQGVLVVVHGKGGHQRVLPLHPEALAALNALPMPRSGHVLRRPMGGRYDAAVMSRSMNNHLRALGIDATAHQLRHWFGTNVYRATHDLRLTQEMLGHQSPVTTAGYAAWSPADAAVAVQGLRVGR